MAVFVDPPAIHQVAEMSAPEIYNHSIRAQHKNVNINQFENQSDAKLADQLLQSRHGVRTILAYCINVAFPWRSTNREFALLCEMGLKSTVDNGWFVDLPDFLNNMQGQRLSVDDSISSITEITNKVRNSSLRSPDGHYYTECSAGSDCVLNLPHSRDELNRALGTAPITPAMNPNRPVRLSNSAAAIFGYLSASLNPSSYAWLNADGTRMSVAETVADMTAELNEDKTRGAFYSCISSGRDDDMATCARVGIRDAMMDRVKVSQPDE